MMTYTDPAALARRTVGDLVAEDYRRAAVFKHFGIDFCCGGGATLEAVCRKKNVDLAQLARALEVAETRGQAPQARVTQWEPAFLADYIVNEHHAYVRESLPVLRAFTEKIARVHGARRPELVEIAHLFEQVATDLEEHMACEERVVFPAIKAATADDDAPGVPPLQDVIVQMEHDHDAAGEAMRQIRELSSDFTPPLDACNTYRAAFVKLEEFEEDLHRHVHLENNVLFPRALALAGASSDGASVDVAEAPVPTTPDVPVLDVRVIPPAQKHPAIFAAFDALAPGAAFVLVNDHDPVPLRYQFEFTRAGLVGWEYLEQGPDVWRVQISRRNEA